MSKYKISIHVYLLTLVPFLFEIKREVCKFSLLHKLFLPCYRLVANDDDCDNDSC